LSLTLREEYKLHKFYSLPNIIRKMKKDKMGRHTGIASMTRIWVHTGLWLESKKERDHHEDLDVSGRIILKWVVFIWLL
jgi:hypothetical protein